MTGRVERIGGTVCLAHDGRADLESMRALTEPEEFDHWLADFERGLLVVVTLELFAEVVREGSRERIIDRLMPGLSFYRGGREDNLQHATDAVRLGVDALSATLEEAAIPTSPEHLLGLPVTVEIEPELARLVGATHGVPDVR